MLPNILSSGGDRSHQQSDGQQQKDAPQQKNEQQQTDEPQQKDEQQQKDKELTLALSRIVDDALERERPLLRMITQVS